MKMYSKKNKKGSIMLGTTIVMLAIALIVAASVQLLGVGEGLLSFEEVQSEQAFSIADSCVREAALRIERSSTWSGGNISFNQGSCAITVSASGSSRTVSVVATVGPAVRKITATMNLSGSLISITSWNEDAS